MKRILCSAAMATIAAISAPALAGPSVSVTIGQPGFFGTIDIGGSPRPDVVYAQPVVVVHDHDDDYQQEPIYLHVPPGHEKHWKKHCGAYNACNRPVYFVKDQWYNNTYAPQYRERHGDGDHGRGDDRHGDHGDHGHGRGHGDHDGGGRD
jgi:hypothetical protein